MPKHVAVIMDGNGRWAKGRRKPRVHGHRAGIESVRDTVEASARLGIQALTLYAFSVENWRRPKHEVWTLMNLLREYLRKDLDRLAENRIRLHVLGRREPLSPSLLAELDRAVEQTSDGDRMSLNVALNYSGRCEIVDACRRIVQDWAAGEPVEIDEETLGRYLYTSGQPDPDLLIRTSGEMRISNFLLWQLAYTEIWVTPKLWPDFRRVDLFEAICDYQARERRFGRVGTDGAKASEGPRAVGSEPAH
ncbi:MAG: isoprenyl transferase [Holophagales bacterium]|nr:isoprenyl transferase [Holophagales bacterium]